MNGTRKQSTCKHPEGCNRPLKSKDLCRSHWDRMKKTGDMGSATIAQRLPGGRPCILEDCNLPVTRDSGKNMCSIHYQRWARHGDASVIGKGGCHLSGPDSPSWGGDGITYHGAHARIRHTRGPASARPCVDCGEQARHWSYNHQDPSERIDPEIGTYSSNPGFYEPRCVPCHSRFDRQWNIALRACR